VHQHPIPVDRAPAVTMIGLRGLQAMGACRLQAAEPAAKIGNSKWRQRLRD